MAAAVIADGAADGFRYAADAAEQIFERLLVQLGMLVECGVQVGDVSVVMLAVMDLHRARVNVRFERVEGVRQFG